jgi:AraC-like DNA-binding protein
MPTTVMEYAGQQRSFDTGRFNDIIHDAVYGADWEVDDVGSIDLKLEKGLDGPVSVMRFGTRGAGIRLRRSVRLIRQYSGDLYFCRLVERGRLRLISSRGTQCIDSGNLILGRIGSPYVAEMMPDRDGSFVALNASIPVQLLMYRMPPDALLDRALPATDGSGLVAGRLLKLLFESGETMPGSVREAVADAFLAALLATVINPEAGRQGRLSISDRRAEDIVEYLTDAASQPGLSATGTAEKFGISRRYLAKILQDRGLTFTGIVHDSRLRLAALMLSSDTMHHLLITEIAQMSGFESPSYFSRAFKRACGCTPAAFRMTHGAKNAANH